ncbi:phage major capsid protein [Streptomyces sp. NBC_00237]|uniref:phage major capsid protein n=1 Tax=Streptomyces sp. NBC_00237 TaxID=2975687 RepID=UPI0022540854|nr:phage major capsid protein [Streptomyces sp. NBC_00237]MCX5201051.1 phage major capsid protein [Streptomyces sp. NBC_00237]
MPELQLSHQQAVIRLKDIRAQLEDLEKRDALTRDDEQTFDELTREFADVDDHRRQLERRSALERVRSATQATDRGPAALAVERGSSTGSRDSYDLDPILNPDSVEDRRFRNPWDLSEVRTFSRSKGQIGDELRARALSAIEKMGGTNDVVRQAATEMIERWDDGDSKIARMCLATSSPEYLRGWAKVATGRGHMIAVEEQQALERAMSLTDSAGGYLVPFQLDPTVIITANGSLNQIRQVARSVVATGDVWNGVSAGSVSWSFAAEATEASDNAPTFAQPSVQLHKAQGFVPISIEAMEDQANATQEVARLLAFGRDELEATKFINGTGSGEPFGIVTALTGTAAELTQGTNTVPLTSVYGLDNSLPARYRMGASWLGHRSIYNVVRQFDTAGGAGMWVQLQGDQPSQLLGRSTYEAEAMTSTVTTGSRNLIYGDFSNYVIADRVGMTVEFIPHLVGPNRRPTGQRGWYAYYRVGADSVNDGAFRMNKVG